jgi:hypothetical protein
MCKVTEHKSTLTESSYTLKQTILCLNILYKLFQFMNNALVKHVKALKLHVHV